MAGYWVWDLYPLWPDAWPNCCIEAQNVQRGHTFKHAKTHIENKPVPFIGNPRGWYKGQTESVNVESSRVFYRPTAQDLATIRRAQPDGNAEDPSWPNVEAELVAIGHDIATLAEQKAPALVRLLEKHVDSQSTEMRDPSQMTRAEVANLAEYFIKCVTDYMEWDKAHNLVCTTAHPRAPGSPAETDLLRRLEDTSGRKYDAAARIRKDGPALAIALERYELDSSGVLSIVHCAGAGGGGPDYVRPNWEETKVMLQRYVIQLRQPITTLSQEVALTSKPKRRGRKPDTDPKADQRIWEAYEGGGCKTNAECARNLNMTEREVKLARDRHRQRLKRRE